MDRYSGRDTVLHAGTYVAPLIPFMFVSAMYNESAYKPSFLEMGLLWLTGLGISYGSIIIHEMGHVIAARLVGIEITDITIGHWRRLVTFPLGTTKITIRAAPASGYVVPELSENLLSAPRVVPFLLAGVAAQAIVIGLIALVPLPPTISSFGDLLLGFCYIDIVCIGGFQAIMNLRPVEGWVGGERLPTDGLQLLQLWKDRHERPAQRQVLLDCQKIGELCEAKEYHAALKLAERMAKDQPANFGLAEVIGTLHRECGNVEEAEMIWRELLKQPIGTSSAAASILDNLSCLPLYHGRMDLLGEAEAWINTAIQYAPNAITLKGTQGSILIELGRIDEGIKVLREVSRRSEDPTDHLICAAYLSKASSLKGDHAEAKQWMDKASEIDAEHFLVKRIEKELASAANPVATAPAPTKI